MKIAAYTCAKNESMHAARWAESVQGEGMFWFVNNCDDDGATMDACADAGITAIEGTLNPFRFDDARNAAMALIPPEYDVVIQLDADETFSDGWAQHFRDNPNHDRWSYWLDAGKSASWWRVKRSNAHRREGFRWVHPVHEVIHGAHATPASHLDEVVILHQPDTGKKRDYYLPWLQRAVLEDPHSARMAFYLGREYYFVGDWVNGREQLMKYVNMDNSWPVEAAEALRLIARMAYDKEGFLLQAIAKDSKRREHYVDMALHYETEGRLVEARGMAATAQRCTDYGRYTSENYCWGEPFDELIARLG